MQYLIDGHNLIPKLGLRLAEPDDEAQLIHILQNFARLGRHTVEAYFDGAPIGQAGTRKFGMVKAHFVRKGRTADSAIRARLNQMSKAAKNWTVISSDHEVQSAARAAQAQAITSEDAVRLIRRTLQPAPKPDLAEQPLSAQQVEEWERLFRAGKQDK